MRALAILLGIFRNIMPSCRLARRPASMSRSSVSNFCIIIGMSAGSFWRSPSKVMI